MCHFLNSGFGLRGGHAEAPTIKKVTPQNMKTYEILYKPNVSIRIIIKEYLDASNLFLNDSQTKYLNALLDNAAKKLRSTNARI